MPARTFGKRQGFGTPQANAAKVVVAAAPPVLIQASRTIDPRVPPRTLQPEAESLTPPPEASDGGASQSATASPFRTVEDELKEWKQQRLEGLPQRLPWRQIALIASLSFGIAELVLPDTVNVAVDWLLDVLAIAGLCFWIAGFKRSKPNGAKPS